MCTVGNSKYTWCAQQSALYLQCLIVISAPHVNKGVTFRLNITVRCSCILWLFFIIILHALRAIACTGAVPLVSDSVYIYKHIGYML